MDEKSDRMTLIERSAQTFESFLGREFGNRFYSDQFLSGITQRRLELHVQLAKSGSLAFGFATLIAFFDLVAGSSFSYSGLTVQITRDLSPIVSLFAAGAVLRTTFAFLDELILFRILIKLGSNIGIHSFPLLLIDKAVINLWADALTPRYFGPKSGTAQKIAFGFVGVVGLLATLLLFLYAPMMVALVGYQTFFEGETRLIAKGISALACLTVFWSILIAIVCSFPFKFSPADWVESTNEPTEAFKARMRAELGAEDTEGETAK